MNAGAAARGGPRLRGHCSGPSCGTDARAGQRSSRGPTPAGIPGCARGCAPRRRTGGGGGRSREQAAGLPEKKAECGHVVRYVLRARAASRSWATSKPGARLGRLPRRLLCLLRSAFALPSCVSPGAHQYGRRREAPQGRGHPAPAFPAEALLRFQKLRGGGRLLSFLTPLFAFARGRTSYTLDLGKLSGHTTSSPPPQGFHEAFCLTRGQNRPQHLEVAPFLLHFCPFKWKYAPNSSEGSREETQGIRSLVYLIFNVS